MTLFQKHITVTIISTLLIGVQLLSAQKANVEAKVNALLKRMTLDEKIGQMNQYNGFWEITGPVPQAGSALSKYEHLKKGWVGSVLNVSGVENVRKLQEIVVKESRLGIPLIFGFDVIHGQRTLSPIPLAESCSWDTAAIRLSAANAAKEASALGINWTFAPMVDITRDARWGRVMEGAGEDPFLGSVIGAARVKGFQGDDLSLPYTIAACTKHFAAYGFAEAGREYNTVDVGTSTLYNVILPPFKATVDAGVKTFMNSFNTLNNIPATGNSFLMRDILKDKWGFKGFVVSDWGSIGEMQAHGFSVDLKDAAMQAAIAGCDMDMESYAYVGFLQQLVQTGKVNMNVIDDAVKRILTVKYELGLFDDPYRYCNPANEKNVIGSAQINTDNLDIARKSIVLLKNDTINNAPLLPLNKNQNKVAVIGALADDNNSILGSWRIGSKDSTGISVLDGFRKSGIEFSYAEGTKVLAKPATFIQEIALNFSDSSGFTEAVTLAAKSETVVMVLGEHGFMTGEGRSRTELGLPGLQQQLLEAVHRVNKNIVLVVLSGRPLVLTWAQQNIPAIVEAWQLGTQSGNAIADVLTGKYNPSGKLTMSFPRNVGQEPLYYGQNFTGRGNPIDLVFWSHYSDVSNTPLYPFGYGLSYTNFAYSAPVVIKNKNQLDISVEVRNSGKVAGEEVVQLYIRDKVSKIVRPVMELKGFKKIMLNAGETRKVNFTLTQKELSYFNNSGELVFEPGSFEIMTGGSSADVKSVSVDM